MLLICWVHEHHRLFSCLVEVWSGTGFFGLLLSLHLGENKGCKDSMRRNSGGFVPSYSSCSFLPGKDFSFFPALFISEAVIFTTEKKEKVNARGKSPKSGDYRAAE